jgi:carbamoyltransferase
VHKDTNPRYWQLIDTFKKRTTYGLIVNTSFNVRGEPIVCTPEDSYLCFMRTEMDYLFCGNWMMSKSEQPKLRDDVDWRRQYELD